MAFEITIKRHKNVFIESEENIFAVVVKAEAKMTLEEQLEYIYILLLLAFFFFTSRTIIAYWVDEGQANTINDFLLFVYLSMQ